MHTRVWVSSAYSVGRLNFLLIDVDVDASESDLILVRVAGCAEVEAGPQPELTRIERDSDEGGVHPQICLGLLGTPRKV